MRNRVALITGGSAGIGKATSLLFAEKGARVIIADVAVEQGEETVRLIRKDGGEAIFLKCDVSDAKQVKGLIDKTVSTFGRIDFAFNNAGIEGISAPTAECTEENWDRTININLKGVWLCMKYEIEQMLKQKQGVIVNNSSIAGLVGFQGTPAYVASKHGILGLTKTAALEYSRQGIRINAVCPGVIRTDMVGRVIGGDPAIEQQFTALKPIGRLGHPNEIAEAVIWLCSDASSFVTGHSMVIDGGFTAQ